MKSIRSSQEGKVWKAVLFILALIAWVVYAQIVARSPESQATDAATRQHLEGLITREAVCSEGEWLTEREECGKKADYLGSGKGKLSR